MPPTEWRGVKGYPNYEVSSIGSVRNKKRGRLLAIAYHKKSGYGCVTLWRNNKPTTLLIHRVVASAFIQNPERKPDVNHKDGNKANNSITNLEWVTARENNLHAYRELGRQGPTGERHGMTTLSIEQVTEIRRRYVSGDYDRRALAQKYGVCPGTISNIVTGKTWKEA